MPSNSQSPFDDVLLCPVCMVVFEGRIIQCSQGHAVCETCRLKLTDCPHCRACYTGTRNYVLEAVISKLKLYRATENINLGDDEDEPKSETMSTNEAPADAVLLVTAPSEATTSTTNIKILAPKGFYQCRIDRCEAKLPSCRLLNHLRYFHKDCLTETTKTSNSNENGDFADHWTMPCATFQKCFHLHNFGVFFLIVNVTRTNVPEGNTNIKAWVQGACPNNAARNFRFSLEMLMGNVVATFTDYVVGAQSDSDYIQENKNCLNVDTIENYEMVTIEMKISKTIGPQNLQRNDRTDCRQLPTTSHVTIQQRQTNTRDQQLTNGINRRNRNRNR